jgi:glucosamine 6-phosphate synthetase-like amidotransferase/phosphosugar isomerase protein
MWTTLPNFDIATRSSAPTSLVIGISQSGETADTLAAMKEARDRGGNLTKSVTVG